MNVQDTRIQQMLKIRRTTLGFGVVQILLGISLTVLSFTAFVFTSSDRIRNACPYWAGFTVFCSGVVGIIAWKNSSVMSMSLFTFFSAVCVVLQMIGTILTGEAGGLLKSLLMCEKQISGDVCMCCDSISSCRHSPPGIQFEGVNDCTTLTGLLTGLMYGLCVLTIFGSFLCFVATILGCTAVARETSRNQGVCSRNSSRRSHASSEEQYTWNSYPTDLTVLPPYAPPVYHSVENFQDYGLSSCIVPPPVFDPTDLPPPYSSQNPSLAESQYSLSSPEYSPNQRISVVQELTEVDLQPARVNLEPAIQNSDVNAQSNEAAATCSIPSGVIRLDGGDPLWDKQVSVVSPGAEMFSASGASCLSPGSTNENVSEERDSHRNSTDQNGRRTVITKSRDAVAFKLRHASCSVPRLQRDVSQILPGNTRPKARASSLATAQVASPNAQLSIHPVMTSLSSDSPVRRTTILSLRTRCSSLGENSIYVNSFEVLGRPPPNVRVPSDEQCKPFTSDSYFNTRNHESCLQKQNTHRADSLIENNRDGCSEHRDRGKHRRRKHPNRATKEEEKTDPPKLATIQVNCAHEDALLPGKETVV